MNWEAIGAIGQVLGSFAVFITLGYLAVQVRHARSDARRALGQNRAEALRDIFAHQSDQRINRLIVKADTAYGGHGVPFEAKLMEEVGLTEEEALLLVYTQTMWWSYNLQMIANVDQLSAAERTSFDGGIRISYGQPGLSRVFYETHIKRTAHPDVVRYIENLLAEGS